MDKNLMLQKVLIKILNLCSNDFVMGIGTGSTTDIFTQTFLPKLKIG